MSATTRSERNFGLDVLRAEEAQVDAAFEAFFPELIHASARMRL